jgi:hypothetical protein
MSALDAAVQDNSWPQMMWAATYGADLLTQAVVQVRPYLDRAIPVGDRVRNLWAGVIAAQGLGAADAVEEEFLRLSYETGLAADLGRHAAEDLRHVVSWAMRRMNPFGR